MKATFDGTTVLNIEYSAKEIKPHFCQATREMEFDCYFDGRYVGTANSHGAAAAKLDELAYEALTHGDTATAQELDGGAPDMDCESAPTIEELKIEVARLTSLKNNQSAEIAKARGKRRTALIAEQYPTIDAIRAAQRQIIALRRQEAVNAAAGRMAAIWGLDASAPAGGAGTVSERMERIWG